MVRTLTVGEDLYLAHFVLIVSSSYLGFILTGDYGQFMEDDSWRVVSVAAYAYSIHKEGLMGFIYD